MLNDVVDTVHKLVAASKQARGITFTDKDGNLITDDYDKETEKVTENEPIPVVDDKHEEAINNDSEEIISEH